MGNAGIQPLFELFIRVNLRFLLGKLVMQILGLLSLYLLVVERIQYCATYSHGVCKQLIRENYAILRTVDFDDLFEEVVHSLDV